MSNCNVLMLTHDGFYRQKDGLAMGSPPAPNLDNGWLSQFDHVIKGESKLYSRYMDDILKEINKNTINQKLEEINSLHPKLEFTVEREEYGCIPFLDMKIIHKGDELTSTWFTKVTDTGLIMNFHALAPLKYKRSVVSGMVHRIHHACSTWINFHESLEKAKAILQKNQYPPSFYEPIINKTLTKIYSEKKKDNNEEEEPEKKLVILQYRGKVTENFERALKRLNVACKIITTVKKIKTILPSLKTPVEKAMKSGLVYKISCSRCQSCYVGQSSTYPYQRTPTYWYSCGKSFQSVWFSFDNG